MPSPELIYIGDTAYLESNGKQFAVCGYSFSANVCYFPAGWKTSHEGSGNCMPHEMYVKNIDSRSVKITLEGSRELSSQLGVISNILTKVQNQSVGSDFESVLAEVSAQPLQLLINPVEILRVLNALLAKLISDSSRSDVLLAERMEDIVKITKEIRETTELVAKLERSVLSTESARSFYRTFVKVLSETVGKDIALDVMNKVRRALDQKEAASFTQFEQSV